MKTFLAVVGGIVLALFGLCIIAAALEWLVWRFDTSTVYYPFPNPYYRQGQAPVIPIVPALPQQSAPVGPAPAWQAPVGNAPVQPQTQAPVAGQDITIQGDACIPRSSYESAKAQALSLGRAGTSAFEGFLESAGKAHSAWADFHGTPNSRPQIKCPTGLCVVYGTTNRTNRPANVRVTPIEGLFERDFNGTDPVDGSGSATFSGTIFPGFTGAYVAICPN